MKTVPKRCCTDGNAAARTFQKSYQATALSLLKACNPTAFLLSLRGYFACPLTHLLLKSCSGNELAYTDFFFAGVFLPVDPVCLLLDVLCVARAERGRYAQKALAKPLGLTVCLVFLLRPVMLACVRFQAESSNHLACCRCYC